MNGRNLKQPFGGTSGKLWALGMGWLRLHSLVLWPFPSTEDVLMFGGIKKLFLEVLRRKYLEHRAPEGYRIENA